MSKAQRLDEEMGISHQLSSWAKQTQHRETYVIYCLLLAESEKLNSVEQ